MHYRFKNKYIVPSTLRGSCFAASLHRRFSKIFHRNMKILRYRRIGSYIAESSAVSRWTQEKRFLIMPLRELSSQESLYLAEKEHHDTYRMGRRERERVSECIVKIFI